MGKFEVGHARVGGRKKGTPNKVNAAHKNRVDTFFKAHWDEFETDIWPQLSAKEKKDTFVALMNYQYPKLQSVDIKDTTERDESALSLLREAVKDSNTI